MTPVRHPVLKLPQRLTLLLAGTVTAALLMFAVTVVVVEVLQARAALVQDLALQAESLVVTLAPALAHEDPSTATEALAALRARPNVIAAWLVPAQGTNALAHYARHDKVGSPPPALPRAGQQRTGRWLFQHQPVLASRARVGTLILQADFWGAHASLATYAAVLALLLALTLGLSLLLATRVQRLVSAPLLDLAETARSVSEHGDYSLRARKYLEDEIGALADGFNRMLARVQDGEAALRASEERFALALRGATDGLWDWDLKTNHVFYSPRWKEMLGYQEEELEQQLRTWERLVHPDDLAPTMRQVKEHLAGSTPQYEVEFRMRHKDGRWIHILSRAIVVRDDAGQPQRLVGTHVDITGRKSIEEALRASEARLAEAQTIARIGSYDVNPQTGAVYWSEEMYRLRQRDRKLGAPTLAEITASIHPGDRDRVERALRLAFEQGGDFREEYRGLLPDGTERYFLSTGKTERDERGRVARFFGTLQDITDRKKAEADLAASQQLIQSIMDHAPVLISAKDLTGRVIMANAQFDLLAGDGAHSFVGKSVFELFPFEVADALWKNDQRALSSGRPVVSEETVSHKDGQRHTYQTVKFLLYDRAGSPTAVCAISVDVTARKQAEAALHESEERYRVVVEGQTELICRFRKDGTLTFVNEVYCRFFGRHATEIVGTKWQPVAVAEDLPHIESRLAEMSPANPVVVIENRVYAGDGRIHWMQFVNRGVFDAQGHLVEMQAVGRDITERKSAQDALRTSEERFRQMAESILQVFWLSDPAKQEVVYISPAYQLIWGRTPQSLYANPKSWSESIHPDDRARVWKAAHEKQVRGEYDEEYRVVRPDGTTVWVRDRAFPVRDDSGKVVSVCGVAEDITARKQAEEQRDRFFNLSLDLLCIAEMSGHFLRVNPAFTRVLGWSQEELLSRPVFEFIHPEDRASTQDEFARLARGENVVDFENRYLCRDGSVRVLSWSCAAPAKGETILFAVGRDVSAQRMAQEALSESEKRFRTLAESAPIGIFLTGREGDCRYVNRRWCDMTGRSWSHALADGWLEALHPDDRERVSAEWAAAVQGGGDFRGEYRYLRPDGGVRWVTVSAAPLLESNGSIAGYVGTVADVTERRLLERQLLEISDREQARLGQEIHDGLCQHLVSTGFAARDLEQRLVQLRQDETVQAREVAQLIDGAITQAYQLVGGLFPAQLDGEGLAAALREFCHHASQRALGTRFMVDYPEPIQLDPAQSTHLFRIAQEAVTNALKHAQPKRVRLRLHEHGGLVRLAVENDGGAFADAGAKSGGFGLRMMRYRANLLGGSLEVRRLDGRGTVVTCVFRVQRPNSAAMEPGGESV